MNYSRFFSNLQEAPWYRLFLDGVINETTDGATVLDIGTGPAKLLQILAKEKEITGIGIDTNSSMLQEAKTKLKGTGITVKKINPNEKYPFDDHQFEVITICNVLFNLTSEAMEHTLSESLRLLKKGGKIIVLTPTGNGTIWLLTQKFFSFQNLAIYRWYAATKKRAKIWADKGGLESYAKEHLLRYCREVTFSGFAQIEVLQN
ncbi:MAG TPA: class I SAM-dependent methyltransferase [Saprospiraceae bacterium]|nr:class I SAM-dependent methyltransferase [Saprospiraceae bacterium]